MPDRWVGRDKRPIEEFVVEWDFVDDVAAGDTVLDVGGGNSSVTATRADTGASEASFIEGAVRSDTKLRAQVQGGLANVDYLVSFKAKTQNGDLFERVVGVRVRA
jgi:hypothetical protein